MRHQREPQQAITDGLNDQEPLNDGPEIIGSEDIHIRNFDHQWGYDLAIEAVDEDGETVLEKRYYLQSGRVESELDVLPAGEYEIEATLDNLKQETLWCRIDDDPEHGVVIEVGNGALSLTEGLSA
ncbi:MAG: hypothetical protein ABEH59_07890 [Halobacteriales archaeon]